MAVQHEREIIGFRPTHYLGLAVIFTVEFSNSVQSFYWDNKRIIRIPTGPPTLFEIGPNYLYDIRNVDSYQSVDGVPIFQAQWRYFSGATPNFYESMVIDVSGEEFYIPSSKPVILEPLNNKMVTADKQIVEGARYSEVPAVYYLDGGDVKYSHPTYSLTSTSKLVSQYQSAVTTSDILASIPSFPDNNKKYLKVAPTRTVRSFLNNIHVIDTCSESHIVRLSPKQKRKGIYDSTYRKLLDKRNMYSLAKRYCSRPYSSVNEGCYRFMFYRERYVSLRVFSKRKVFTNVPDFYSRLVWIKRMQGFDLYQQYSFMITDTHYAMYECLDSTLAPIIYNFRSPPRDCFSGNDEGEIDDDYVNPYESYELLY